MLPINDDRVLVSRLKIEFHQIFLNILVAESSRKINASTIYGHSEKYRLSI
jgi:hypothetical protein